MWHLCSALRTETSQQLQDFGEPSVGILGFLFATLSFLGIAVPPILYLVSHSKLAQGHFTSVKAVLHDFCLSTCLKRPIHIFSLTNTDPWDRSPNCWNIFSVQKKPVIQMGLFLYDSIILWNSALKGYHKDVYTSVHIRTFFQFFYYERGVIKFKPTF